MAVEFQCGSRKKSGSRKARVHKRGGRNMDLWAFKKNSQPMRNQVFIFVVWDARTDRFQIPLIRFYRIATYLRFSWTLVSSPGVVRIYRWSNPSYWQVHAEVWLSVRHWPHKYASILLFYNSPWHLYSIWLEIQFEIFYNHSW